jgi:alpha-L-rhamnosidase
MHRLAVLLISCFFTISLSHAALEIQRLKVESLTAPLGLCETSPRFSWELASATRGARQSAYQIRVATEKFPLTGDQPLVWDSGRIESNETTQISYAGPALTSNQHLYWQVSVWDENGTMTRSSTAEWSMGLLAPGDWNAEWIGIAGPPSHEGKFPDDARWVHSSKPGNATFRKNFTLTQLPATSELLVATEQSYTLCLNGRHIMTGAAAAKEGQALDIAPYLIVGVNVVTAELKSPNIHTSKLLVSSPLFTEPTWKVMAGDTSFRERFHFDDSAWPVASISAEPAPRWISQNRHLPARLLRRDFESARPIKRATLHLIGVGYHEAFINGVKISDHVHAPGITDYSKRLPVVTHDVTSNLQTGSNTLGIHLGNGRYYAPRNQVPAPTINSGWPVAKARLIIEYQDGSQGSIVTDASWKATDEGPIRANNDYDGEAYDARREQAGWASPGFDAASWKSAEILPGPTGSIAAVPCQPIRVTATLPATKLTEIRPGVWIFDFGQNIAGWCRLHVKGPEGSTVMLRHAETLNPDGSLKDIVLRSAQARDFYTLKGDSNGETWEPRFTSHGFRYAELSGFLGTPTLASLEARVVGNDLEMTGDFTCSNPLLNQIVKNARWGIRSNFLSVPTDCPQRDERQGWQGDRSTETRSETFLFDVAAFYTKYLDEIRASQRPDGNVSDVAPALWQFYSGSAVWPSIQTVLPETLYLKYGDKRLLEKHYAGNVKWLEFLLTRRGPDGLLPADTYGDWVAPPETRDAVHPPAPDDTTDKKLIANAFLAKHLSLMAWSARRLGKSADATRWQQEFEKFRPIFQQKFWNAGRAAFGNGTQTSYAITHAFDLVPPLSKPAFTQSFLRRIREKDRSHIGTGVIGTQWIHHSLDDLGQSDMAFTMATQRDYPSWGYMIDNDATTIWELWNGDTAEPSMNSGNHIAMIGDSISWCFERLAGIQSDPDAPGYRHIILAPTLPSELTEVNASHHTPQGFVRSHWKNQPGQFQWNVEIPANTEATLYFPPHALEPGVLESSDNAMGAGKIQFLGQDAKQRTMLKISSGTYHFTQAR